VQPYIDRLEAFSQEDAEAIVDQIPDDWGVTLEECEALVRYLVTRAPAAATALKSKFPAQGGSE
jgi:HEAT repeat protein